MTWNELAEIISKLSPEARNTRAYVCVNMKKDQNIEVYFIDEVEDDSSENTPFVNSWESGLEHEVNNGLFI